MLKKIINKISHFRQRREKGKRILGLQLQNVFIEQIDRIHPSVVFDSGKIGIIEIGKDCEIAIGCLLMSYGGSIKVGNYCSINPYTIIYGHGKGVTIGNNVLIAAHTVIIPANHIFKETNVPINSQGETSKGIVIGDDVWIAANCKILDGVIIGNGAIIGAGSVVNKSIPPYAVAAGVPARIIKMRK